MVDDVGGEERVVGAESRFGGGREVGVLAEEGEDGVGGERGGERGGGDCEDAEGVGEEEGLFEDELEVFLVVNGVGLGR